MTRLILAISLRRPSDATASAGWAICEEVWEPDRFEVEGREGEGESPPMVTVPAVKPNTAE